MTGHLPVLHSRFFFPGQRRRAPILSLPPPFFSVPHTTHIHPKDPLPPVSRAPPHDPPPPPLPSHAGRQGPQAGQRLPGAGQGVRARRPRARGEGAPVRDPGPAGAQAGFPGGLGYADRGGRPGARGAWGRVGGVERERERGAFSSAAAAPSLNLPPPLLLTPFSLSLSRPSSSSSLPPQLTYSTFISGLKTQGVTLNRKVLAALASQEPLSFRALAREVAARRGAGGAGGGVGGTPPPPRPPVGPGA